MAFKHFHNPVVMDGPVEYGMAFLGSYQYCQIAMSMTDELYLMIFHIKFPKLFAVLSIVDD
jgi:hypothetical protein